MQKLIVKRFLGVVLGAAFVLTAFFGVHLTMKQDMKGQMQNCPLLGRMESVCPMTVTEHINAWQQLLTATFQSNKLLLMDFALVALFGVLAFTFNFSFVRRGRAPPPYSEGFLLEAFSKGILRKRE